MGFTHDDILLPLAITVIIDKKIRSPEMAAFARQAKGLIEMFDLSPMDDKSIKDWFDREEPEIERKLNSPMRNTLVLRALSRFKDDRDVENIFDAMVSISVSDKEYVRSESDLIKSAAAIWGFDRPPLKIKRDEK